MKLSGGQVFDVNQGFVARDLWVEEGRVAASGGGETVDVSGCYVIPGLTDLHFHGCVGEDFSDATAEGLQKMADYELSRGVTQICPAGMTLSEEQLTKICRNAANHCKQGDSASGAELVGVNLEGPFLCYAKKGAQNAAYLHDPDGAMLHRLQTAAEGLVKLVTLAAEQPGSIEFIKAANADGVRVSLGHTTADYDTANKAYLEGARHATHLFNAMPPFTHREPGVVGAAFDNKDVTVELITDGVHIHPSVVRSVFQLFGRDRVIIISDSLRATGMPDGEYPFGGQMIEVHGNRATMLGQPDTLAGSVSDLMACMKTAVSFGIPMVDAVTAAAVNPAKALGIYDNYGSLDVGKAANLVVLDRDLNLKRVMLRGKFVS